MSILLVALLFVKPIRDRFIKWAQSLKSILVLYFVSRFVAVAILWFVEDWRLPGSQWWTEVINGYWWTGVSALTIGYGDFFPKTIPGILIADGFQHFWIFYCGLAIAAHLVKLLIHEVNTYTHKEQEWHFDVIIRIFCLTRWNTYALMKVVDRLELRRELPPVPYLQEDGRSIKDLPPQPRDTDEGNIEDEYDAVEAEVASVHS